MKRLLAAALAAGSMLCQVPTAQAVGTSASSAILMEAESGRVLYEQNAHEERLIASITKLMTALVALESGHDLEETVTVGEACTRAEGSSLYLRPGEEISLKGLLYGVMLRSGNDAALAVAEHCGGSVEEFVGRMNEKAAQLGMVNSHFANPNGLNAEGHYSSAYDMALLARACLENEALAEIAATKSATVDGRVLTNHNKLLWQYEGCIGLKTGYTEKAGRTLVSAARRGGMTLIAVTLNDPDDWRDHTALLDYGFSTYAPVTLTEEGKAVARRPVSGSLVPFVEIQAAETVRIPVCEEDKIDWVGPGGAGGSSPGRRQCGPDGLPGERRGGGLRASGVRPGCGPCAPASWWDLDSAYGALEQIKKERGESAWRSACKSCCQPAGWPPAERWSSGSRRGGSPSMGRRHGWGTRRTWTGTASRWMAGRSGPAETGCI